MPQVDVGQLDLAPAHLALLQRLLAEQVPAAEVWAYGSRVNGCAHEGSDLDLVLRPPDDAERDAEHCQELKAALQGSALPMLVEIHLWSRLPAAFRAEIERCYVVVQAGVIG